MKFFKKIFLFIASLVYTLYLPASALAMAGLILYAATPAFAALDCWSPESKTGAAKISDLECVFKNVLSLAIPGAGIVAFIMLIAGGFKYLTSGGDPKKSQEAQQAITYAVIGLILLVSAYIIINFISTFTGVDVTKFVIPK